MRIWWLLPLALSLSGCGDREENEARMFLDRIRHVDADQPVAERRRHIDAVAALTLRTEELQRVRDTCVDGHRHLITAEEEQAEATRALAEASDGDPDAELPEAEAQEIRAAIEASNASLRSARDLLTSCQQEVQALEHRFSSRR